MKSNEKNYLILIPIGFILLCCVVVVLLSLQPELTTKSFIKLDTLSKNAITNNYKIIHSEEEYDELLYFTNKEDLHFKTYNYILIQINTGSCGEKDIVPEEYSIEDHDVLIKIFYTAECESCYIRGMREPEYDYYLLPISKRMEIENVSLEYEARNEEECSPIYVEKPMIYLYPEKEMNVQVELGYPALLEASYPPYQDGWNVLAKPDGTLRMRDREYYGLFWEGNHHEGEVHDEGFLVKGEDIIPFLEEKLKILGLNDREINEFIIYWYPRLKDNPYNYIYFETLKEINHYMPLYIQPNPDSIIRVQMDYKPLSQPISVVEQNLVSPQRKGFTVVEWGGSIIKKD